LSKPKAVNARKFHKPRNTDVKIIIQEQIETILDAFPIVRATQTQTNTTTTHDHDAYAIAVTVS
jgi:hypothetical protein